MKFNNPEQKSKNESFVLPNVEKEMGEIERIAEEFAPNAKEEFIERFLETAKSGKLSLLEDDTWSKLENSDSYKIKIGDWSAVDEVIEHYNQTHNAKRDWEDLKHKVEKEIPIDAPIIFKNSEHIHLVSGNTRLMVVRALGKKPEVLIVEF